MATVAGILGIAGSAIASSPALAFHLTNGSATGPALAPNVPYTAGTSSIAFVNSTNGVLAQCTGSSTLNGVTVNSSNGLTGTATGINVKGGSFNTCSIKAGGVNKPLKSVIGDYTTPWAVQPTSNPSTNVFNGTVSNIKVTLDCTPTGGTTTSSTYSGTLSTGGQEQNVTGGSKIVLTNAQSLSLTGTVNGGCALPTSVGVTGTYTLTTLNGSAVSATNNIWENNA